MTFSPGDGERRAKTSRARHIDTPELAMDPARHATLARSNEYTVAASDRN
jgi:hypothetical protein